MKTTVISITKKTTQRTESQQHMTSLEIAELTGKQHSHVMRDIRNMEPAWEKVNGSKFGLVEYQDRKGEYRPCYSLTKIECLYIATKFNDEARAKLVLRWEELERAKALNDKEQMINNKPKEIRLLACDEEVLDEADDIIGEELDELNRYSDHCFTPSEIAKPYGLDGRDLNSFLADQGIIRWGRGQWNLTPKYRHKGYTENRCFIYHGRNGHRKMESRLVWTEEGRDFIKNLIN